MSSPTEIDALVARTIAALVDQLNRCPPGASSVVIEAQIRPTVEQAVSEAARLGRVIGGRVEDCA